MSKNKKRTSSRNEMPAVKKTNLELSQPAVAALTRLKSNHGVGRTFAIERGVIMLEQSLDRTEGGLMISKIYIATRVKCDVCKLTEYGNLAEIDHPFTLPKHWLTVKADRFDVHICPACIANAYLGIQAQTQPALGLTAST